MLSFQGGGHMMEKAATTINSVDKAMELLDILLSERTVLSLQELTERSGFSKSTVHALLSTMCRHNVVSREKGGRYRLGVRLFEYGCAVADGWDISREARPYLEELSEKTRASSFLSLVNGLDVIIIGQYAGGSGLHVTLDVGTRLPLHATAQGKVLLAHMEEREVIKHLRQSGMPAYTPHTVTDEETLLRGLSDIRANGYAVEDGEYKIGLRSVSVPIYDNAGSVCYAIGVVGLFRNTRSDEFQNAIRQTVSAAEQISKMLGFRAKVR